MEYILPLIFSIGFAIMWGFLTRNTIYNKGYDSDWFWWGFFFGLFAFIVACTKPQIYNPPYPSNNFYNHDTTPRSSTGGYIPSTGSSQQIPANYWTCACGRNHPPYVSSCSCGRSKHDKVISAAPAPVIRPASAQSVPTSAVAAPKAEPARVESSNIAAIKEYKELLDAGIITEEEFSAKKKQLLGL